MRLAILTTAFVALLSTPALAAPIVGVGDQHDEAFNSPLFAELGAKHARVTIPWDATRPGFARADADAVLSSLRLRGVEPLVVVGNSRYRGGMPSSAKVYRKSVAALVARYPFVRYWSPANESNLFSGRRGNPKVIASFALALHQICRSRGCTVTSPTVLDQPNLARWASRYRAALPRAARPKIWLLHNYIDANRFKFTASAKFMRMVRFNYVWLAETGGLVRGRGKNSKKWPKGLAHQVRVFNWLTTKYAARYRNVTRIYIYQWQSSPQANWDSGILNYNGTPRPLYKAMKDYLAAN